MTEIDEPGTIERLATAAREVAVAAAEAAMKAVIRDLLSPTDDDDNRLVGLLSQDPHHPGSPARAVDALAQAAALIAAEQKIEELSNSFNGVVRHVAYVGEELGVQTRLILPGMLVVRFDPLDGTTNASNILSAFASVATVDIITDPSDRPRHLAGAVIGGEIDVSWLHWSKRAKSSLSYPRPAGRVFVRSCRFDSNWRRLELEQDDRDVSVASVAATFRRFTALGPFREAVFAADGTVYHMAGSPMCAGLLLGRIGAIVETQNVTLHDSAYLIPHWLLGGRIESLDFQPVDYMSNYELNAINFDPRSKPIEPFIAFAGKLNPLRKVSNVRPRQIEDAAASRSRRLFRSDAAAE